MPSRALQPQQRERGRGSNFYELEGCKEPLINRTKSKENVRQEDV